METDEMRELDRYSKITNKLKIIASLLYSMKKDLPWYVAMTRKLSVGTERKTGVSGNLIADLAESLIASIPVIEKIKKKAREIEGWVEASKHN